MKCKVNVVLPNEFDAGDFAVVAAVVVVVVVVTFSPRADSTREKVFFLEKREEGKVAGGITRVLGSSTMQISSLFRLTVTITGELSVYSSNKVEWQLL